MRIRSIHHGPLSALVIKKAYDECKERVGQMGSPKGAKTEAIVVAVRGFPGNFSVGDVQNACPGVSIDMIRRTLNKLKAQGAVECLGMGRNASWLKK